MTGHSVEIVRDFVVGGYTAECSCGWTSERCHTTAEALAAGEMHQDAAADRLYLDLKGASSADHDFCDACGRLTVVTDVWINRLPVTLCQPCILDALTAEGESLGRYWEIES